MNWLAIVISMTYKRLTDKQLCFQRLSNIELASHCDFNDFQTLNLLDIVISTTFKRWTD